MSNLLLTNSLTKKKEIFKPINQNKISMYACGPTVYDSPHVGNARSLVVFDVLFRVLKFFQLDLPACHAINKSGTNINTSPLYFIK